MDAGERSSTDASGPPDSTGQMLSSRLCQLHSIQEARIALKYLFRQASSSEVSKINLETQICELESQLNAEKRKSEENSKSDADSHKRRCKFRGTCQARCSCRRSGRPCVPSHCHCVLGLRKNRSDSSSQNSQIVSSVENPATVMGPPSGFPVILRPKRKTRALQI
ncbi:unnamed protein product [Schistosoma mattheei]|uniref:Uncharacterized protein n=1 Tax=Schistosoma mattheei TaxID=31246 RepID=A0AA85AT90_9TREM|nr:unnamed protein product [Schistosoma mattheei]